MSLEEFTRYAARHGWTIHEQFYPAGMLEDEDGNPVPDEDFTVTSATKFEGNVFATFDISDAMLLQGEQVWELAISLGEEELARQRRRALATSDS